MDVSTGQLERERYAESVAQRRYLRARIAARRLGLSRRQFRAHWLGLTPDQVVDRPATTPDACSA